MKTAAAATVALVLMLGPGVAPIHASEAPPPTVWVAVKKTALRAEPGFPARAVTTVEYTTPLTVEGRNGDWLSVRHGKTAGWVHRSAVDEQLVVQAAATEGAGSSGGAPFGLPLPGLTGRQAPRAADVAGGKYAEDEVTLAGKGFNREVEQQYRSSHAGQVDYAALGLVEARQPGEKAVAGFARAGQLEARPPSPFLVAEAASSGDALGGAADGIGDAVGDIGDGIGNAFGSIFGGGSGGQGEAAGEGEQNRQRKEEDPWATVD